MNSLGHYLVYELHVYIWNALMEEKVTDPVWILLNI